MGMPIYPPREPERRPVPQRGMRPIPSTKKLEQEITNEDRQLKRLTDRLDKADATHLDAVIAKAEEMGRQLAAKRERLEELQRAGRRPRARSVRETDVVAALTRLRELLQGAVGFASQVLKALVGDVVIESRTVEGKAKPELVARFTINAIPALAVLDRGGTGASDGAAADPWDAICHKPQAPMGSAAMPRTLVVPLRRRCHRATSDVPVMPPADSRPPQAS